MQLDFVSYLKTLKPEDWNKMATPKWRVKDVVAHMVGWEKRDAEVIKIFWETKKRKPWMSTREEWDEFNRKEVERYKNYTPQELIEEWEMWQKKVSEEIDKIGYENIKAHPDLFDWVLEDEDHYTLNEGGSHYEHHYEQVKKAVGQKPKIIEVSIPEYTIDKQPDYEAVGSRIDKALADSFEGTYLLRALSIADHPQYTLDEFVAIILKTGTDKYDLNRKGVDHEVFEPYQPDLQAGTITIKDGKIIDESFSADIKRFYENTLLDRGYRLRIDLLVLYDPEQMVKAEKVDTEKPSIAPHLEEYLWRFKDPKHKPKALVGIIKMLR